MNQFKTFLLMLVLTGLLIVVGSVIGGRNGAIYFFVFAALINFVTYWFSDKIVLRMYGAKQVTQGEAPELYQIVGELVNKASLPMPKVYIMDNDTPNAFATGRNPEHAAVAVTSGILRILSKEELMGVIGHELSHIQHRDILISTIAATMAGAISMLARVAQWGAIFGVGRSDDEEGGGGNFLFTLVFTIVASIAAMLIQMAISRSREYLADEGGAHLSHPLSLARALGKLEVAAQRIPMEANPSTAHMFIVNPLRGGGVLSLFSTHPPIEERIARLEEMARTGRF
ncbi:MAG: protease HtpX [Deltaproteobacteria bacterium CG_4_8_14_3_um_filter_45_9]|nr:MAG: protease HtpX [Deltaproteobacteria bacterium CG03_land_8_20_14_0_80_45_14]PIX26649.1 MAG: protease HtpX [Deltaproteobacteria bacterium CG_4_8_14_3_um_filter_45_9]